MVESRFNSEYQKGSTKTAIKKQFQKEGSVLLHEFLEKGFYNHLSKEIRHISWRKDWVPQTRSQWIASELPLGFKALLQDVDTLQATVSHMAGKTLKVHSMSLCNLRAGDYVLQHEKQVQGVHVILELTPTWHPAWGGFTSLVEGGEELVRINPAPNSVSIIDQKKGQVLFVKYVNHHATSYSRIFLHMVLRH